jgi:hypothetical protein
MSKLLKIWSPEAELNRHRQPLQGCILRSQPAVVSTHYILGSLEIL